MSAPMFEVVEEHDLRLDCPEPLRSRALLSPYVWRERGQCCLLLRAQPADDGVTGRIWLGEGADGKAFRLDQTPLIVPTLPRLDIGGCEDPTVIRHEGQTFVFYTGVDEEQRGELLLASGPDIRSLEKRGVAHACSHTERNTKEASVSIADDWWRLFFEFAHDGRSCVGHASARAPKGPWTEHADPLRAREGHFDSFHLSTGPFVDFGGGDLVMFYNGADRQPRWCIGWATFNRETLALTARGDAPLIEPPADDDNPEPIVFAASALRNDDGTVTLYYSRNDDLPRRATIRRL